MPTELSRRRTRSHNWPQKCRPDPWEGASALPEKKSEPAVPAGTSVHSDLQYVSIQLDGGTYGGWYRLLPDGRMELLAQANMHRERRSENTPVEQAQAMLTDFIRGARRRKVKATLGTLLYADSTKARVSEQDWIALVRSIAARNPAALRELYERAHRIVFTLLVRLTSERARAEELTLDVFHDAWRRASDFDPAEGSVLGWLMHLTRSRGAANRSVVVTHSDAVETFDVLQPSPALWECLAGRLGLEGAATASWRGVEWENVAPGISCQLLATDNEKQRVSMLVRLAPGTDYPPHTHAGVEELHLLQGELLIDDRKLSPGAYNRAEPGTADKRVWSGTGCMCVLITSTRDAIA